MSSKPAASDTKLCPACRGNGHVQTEGRTETCPVCSGSGRVDKQFHERMSKGERQAMGGAGGALFGAAVGGPVGAVVGGVLGAAFASSTDGDDNDFERRVKNDE
ncbi:YuiA family protein [Halorussus ruber]|uniref:YuiA family protein n=1 Tax=Halorussus ruber TaxID=1126238 RepID=UPI001091E6CD|nr:hypothetical protein [Halorussus ruber]